MNEVGEQFTAQGFRWLVYEISPDGIVRSRSLGRVVKNPPAQRPKRTVDDLVGMAQCSFQTNHRHGRMTRCERAVVSGTTLCAEHQWAKRYAVDRTTD